MLLLFKFEIKMSIWDVISNSEQEFLSKMDVHHAHV